MLAFAWLMGSIAALMGAVSLLSYGLFIGTGTELWLKRARLFRTYALAAVLFWFNVWMWGTVVEILINW